MRREHHRDMCFKECELHLKLNGFCAKPDCKVCDGIGWVTDYSNKVMYCKAEGCMQDSYNKHRKGETSMLKRGIEQKYTFLTFDRIKGSYEAFKAAKAWTQQKFVMLLIYGGVGNGKTFLCQAAAYELANRQENVFVYTVPDLMTTLKSLINPKNDDDKSDYNQMIDHLKNVDYLILDEFKSRSTYELELLEEVVCYRYGHCKFTFITSNMDLPDIEKLSQRIYDRLIDATLSKSVVNTAPSYRPNKKQE